MTGNDYLDSSIYGLLQGVAIPADVALAQSNYLPNKMMSLYRGESLFPKGNSVPEKILEEYKTYMGEDRPIQKILGTDYQPQTKGGEYLKSIGSMVPLSMAGPGGWAAKLGMAVGSGAGGQAGGDLAGLMTNDNPYAQMAGRFAGSMLGGLGSNAISNSYNYIGNIKNRPLVDDFSDPQLAKLNVLSKNPKYLERIKPELEARDNAIVDQIDSIMKPYINNPAQYAARKESLLSSGTVDTGPIKDYLNQWIKTRQAGVDTEGIKASKQLIKNLAGKEKNPLSLDDLRNQYGVNLSESPEPIRRSYQMLKEQIDATHPGYSDLLSQGRQSLAVGDLATEFRGALGKGSTTGEHLNRFNQALSSFKSDMAKSKQPLPQPLQEVVDKMDDYMRFYKGRGGNINDMTRRAYLGSETKPPSISEADLTKPLGIPRRIFDSLSLGDLRRWYGVTNPIETPNKIGLSSPSVLAGVQAYNQTFSPTISSEKYNNINQLADDFYKRRLGTPNIQQNQGVEPLLDNFYKRKLESLRGRY